MGLSLKINTQRLGSKWADHPHRFTTGEDTQLENKHMECIQRGTLRNLHIETGPYDTAFGMAKL